jgi:hypothetical protein
MNPSRKEFLRQGGLAPVSLLATGLGPNRRSSRTASFTAGVSPKRVEDQLFLTE